MTSATGDEGPPPRAPGWRATAVATALYAACLAVATYPTVTHLDTALPSGSRHAVSSDAQMHLWVMRWYKSCLLEGRSPVLCPDVQFPTGAPIGDFSPMHLQALLYLPLSAVVKNDVLCYNILWIIGFLTAGLGTALLAWHVVRDGACAWLAGLLAMLSGPMVVHAHAHLELIYVGVFPLFLLAWLRFVDRPGWGRLAAAGGAFVALTMGAAYFMVLAIPPAAWYVGWRMVGAGRRGAWPWLRARAGWLAAFALAAAPLLAALFAGQFWAMAHGHSMARERSQFDLNAAPLWSYLAPTEVHALGQLLPFDVYREAGHGPRAIETVSYLGVVALLLIHHAAVSRAKFPRAGYWWGALGLLVVLSMGSAVHVGSHAVELPGAWLWRYVPVFRLTRNPARFNLLAAVVAAVVAAAGLRQWLGRLRGPAWRAAAVAGLSVVAVADLGVRSFEGAEVPAMPACYRALAARGPRAALLEIPMACSGAPWTLNASCGYWQSIHRLRTNAGYSGHDNEAFDNLAYGNSPFAAPRLADPGYLTDPERMDIDVARQVRFDDYAWLYVKALGFDAIVLHQWPGSVPEVPVRLERVKARLRPALVAEDAATAVYDPARLPLPTRPVVLRTDGWFHGPPWRGRYAPAVARVGHLAAYNPEAGRDLTLTLEAEAFRRPRAVRVVASGRELARWTIRAGALASYTSPAFRLPAGLQELTIESDGEERPVRGREAIAEGQWRPYSLRVAGVGLMPAAVAATIARGEVRR
jgi:hypothetical protein